jgi:hypothetical protein
MSHTLRYLFSFRPTGLPPLSWTAMLLLLTGLVVALQLSDALLTYFLLVQPDRLIIEANPLMAELISNYGLGGLLLAKALGSLLIIALIDALRRRGFRRATYGLTWAALLFGAAVTANGLLILAG